MRDRVAWVIERGQRGEEREKVEREKEVEREKKSRIKRAERKREREREREREKLAMYCAFVLSCIIFENCFFSQKKCAKKFSLNGRYVDGSLKGLQFFQKTLSTSFWL